MTELALEQVTKMKCVDCGDKLSLDCEIETGYCVICDPSDWEDERLDEEEF